MDVIAGNFGWQRLVFLLLLEILGSVGNTLQARSHLVDDFLNVVSHSPTRTIRDFGEEVRENGTDLIVLHAILQGRLHRSGLGLHEAFEPE